KNCSLQLQFATAANDDEEGVFGFMQYVYPVFRVQEPRIGIGVFRYPKAFRVYVMDSASADDNCVGRSSQEAHDETVCWVRTTDCRAASLAFNFVAGDTVKSRNKIRNNKRPLGW